MVGGTLQQQQQPQASQLAPPLSSSSTTIPVATTEEEEFLKRNTDCVYFLASPLTCKKGSECEYRHSDIARVNPRDCWYWLNGNCLNPKCAFRHPPLDGLLGAEIPPPVGPTLPQAQVTPSPHGTPYPMSKQGVPCIFFQKGFCLKGHLCPFLHGPPNKTMPPVPSNNATNPSKMASEKPIQEQKLVQQETLQKPIEFPPPKMKQNPTPARNGGGGGGGGMEKVAAPPVEEVRYRPANVVAPPVVNEFPVNRSNHGVYETHVLDTEGINGKDVDEYSREPTPGFDVLVDNEVGDSEYYPNEEQFGSRSRGHDFEMGRPVDYDVDQDIYGEQREGYAWEDHRESSERILGGAHNFGRKRYPRDESPDQFDKSDLRHRISNQRRGSFGNFGNVGNVANVGGLRSVISREHPRDNHTDRMPRRDSHHHDRHNDRHNNHHRIEPGSLSSRLRGRIKIPGGNENGPRVEREIDMGRHNRSRYSPRLPPGRFRDRINEGREYRGPRNDSEFTKRSQKDDGQSQSQSQSQPLGKRKYGQQAEEGLSFEGPKPLSEILKRKRGGSVNNDENNNTKENNGNENENENENGRKEVIQPRSSVVHVIVNNEESGLNDEDALLDEELEGYDHKDGDYDYEQIDGEEEYNLEEGEEEYMEEEEEGGKKESQVYS